MMENIGYLGIDVSKGYADFLLLSSSKQVLENTFQLEDTSSGRKELGKIIKKWFSNGLKQLYCGVESTGGYENNWYSYLQNVSRSLPVKVARLNARGPKAIGDASLVRTITDAVSADHIACYLVSFAQKIRYAGEWQSEQKFKEGRQHFSFINMLIKQKVQLENQLEKLIYQYFGEMAIYCRHGMPVWLLRLLTRYPEAKKVIEAGVAQVASIKGISHAKADSIISKARKSEQHVDMISSHTIAMTAKEILSRMELIQKEKQYLINRFKDDPNVKILETITGIGVETAVIVAIEIEDIKRFKSVKSLCSYFGVHPTFKQSGDGIWGNKMSKKGRSQIRARLYMSGISALRADESIKQLYARFRSQGMNHYAAMGVVMHKLLRIIYGVLKTQTAYDPAIDQENRDKAEKIRQQREETNKAKIDRKNRYQKISDDAPTSRVKNKKIKQEASQASNIEESTGSQPALESKDNHKFIEVEK